jgi:hypothetical protein
MNMLRSRRDSSSASADGNISPKSTASKNLSSIIGLSREGSSNSKTSFSFAPSIATSPGDRLSSRLSSRGGDDDLTVRQHYLVSAHVTLRRKVVGARND